MGRCRGDHQVSSQCGALHLTLTWPPRVSRAAGQSQGSQVIVTVPGRHGWWARHSAGQVATVIELVKHIFECTRWPWR